MEKAYICISYNYVTNISKFVAIRQLKFEGDNGLVHLDGLNQKDSLDVEGKRKIGEVRVAKIEF